MWFSTFHDPQGPYTEWVKLEAQFPVSVSGGGSWGLTLPVEVRVAGAMTGAGQVQLSGAGSVLSNVELVADGSGGRTYTSSGPFMFQTTPGADGETIFIVTPLTLYDVGAS